MTLRGNTAAIQYQLDLVPGIKPIKKAGLEKTLNQNISNDALFKNLVEIWNKFRKQPEFRDLTREISAFSSHTYSNRFGGWRKALAEFVIWANSEEIPVESGAKIEPTTQKISRSINW